MRQEKFVRWRIADMLIWTGAVAICFAGINAANAVIESKRKAMERSRDAWESFIVSWDEAACELNGPDATVEEIHDRAIEIMAIRAD